MIYCFTGNCSVGKSFFARAIEKETPFKYFSVGEGLRAIAEENNIDFFNWKKSNEEEYNFFKQKLIEQLFDIAKTDNGIIIPGIYDKILFKKLKESFPKEMVMLIEVRASDEFREKHFKERLIQEKKDGMRHISLNTLDFDKWRDEEGMSFLIRDFKPDLIFYNSDTIDSEEIVRKFLHELNLVKRSIFSPEVCQNF